MYTNLKGSTFNSLKLMGHKDGDGVHTTLVCAHKYMCTHWCCTVVVDAAVDPLTCFSM